MADRTFDDLVNKIQPSAPSCPRLTIMQYVRDSAIRTCERTLAWRYAPATFALTNAVAEYTYSTPANAATCAMISAIVNDVALTPLRLEDALRQYPDWTASSGAPVHITELAVNKYVVLPTPDDVTTYTMRMFLALKPLLTATGMDEVPYNDLEEVILHGALQHLLVLPNVQWTDRELAAYHAKQYTYRVAERRAKANLGNARTSLSVCIPSFN